MGDTQETAHGETHHTGGAQHTRGTSQNTGGTAQHMGGHSAQEGFTQNTGGHTAHGNTYSSGGGHTAHGLRHTAQGGTLHRGGDKSPTRRHTTDSTWVETPPTEGHQTRGPHYTGGHITWWRRTAHGEYTAHLWETQHTGGLTQHMRGYTAHRVNHSTRGHTHRTRGHTAQGGETALLVAQHTGEHGT